MKVEDVAGEEWIFGTKKIHLIPSANEAQEEGYVDTQKLESNSTSIIACFFYERTGESGETVS